MIVKRNFLSQEYLQVLKKTYIHDIILKKEAAAAMKKEVYFHHFIVFIDFYSNFASFSERVAASKLLIQICNITQMEVEAEYYNQLNIIKKCLIYLLDFYILLDKQVCADLIPKIWCNVLIINGLNLQKTVQYFNRISKMTLNNAQSQILILLRCFLEFEQIRCHKTIGNDLLCEGSYQIIKIMRYKLNALFLKATSKDRLFIRQIDQLMRFRLQFQDPQLKIIQPQQILDLYNNLFDPHIKKQLTIFHYSSIVKHFTFYGRNQDGIRYIQAIQQLQTRQKPQVIKLQYYHFICLELLKKIGYFSYMDSFLDKLKICIDNESLLGQYYIQRERTRLKWQHKDYKLQSTYISFLDFIQQADLSELQHKIACFSFVGYISYSYVQHQNQKVKSLYQQILEILKHKLPLSLLQDMKKFYLPQQSHKQDDIFKAAENFVLAMIEIHKDTPNFFLLVEQFFSFIKRLWQKIDCAFCKERSTEVVYILQIRILEAKRCYKQAVQACKAYVNRQSSYFMKLKISALIGMMIFTMKLNPDLDDIYKCMEFIYEWTKNNNAWDQYFNSQEIVSFQIINRYLMGNGNYNQYCLVQLKYLEVIQQYPTVFFIKIYLKQFIQSFFLVYPIKYTLIKTLQKEEKLFENIRQNEFSFLFFAILIMEVQYFQTQRFKMLAKLICRKVNCLSSQNRKVVLGHLYYALLKKYIMNPNQFKHRLKLHVFKKFVRNKISQVKWEIFKAGLIRARKGVMCNFDGKIQISQLYSHLKLYYRQIVESSESERFFEQEYHLAIGFNPLKLEKLFSTIE